MSRKVLVVDDEKLIVKGIRFSLEQDGMDVDCAYDGEEALKLIRENKYNIILLDVMLPKLDGFQVCQQVREFSDVPIVMLTAKGEDMDKILGLEYGADDYITKPFNILEVKARIKAIMRRTERQTEERPEGRQIVKGDMKIDCEGRRVVIGEREVNLTAKEFDLLELLAMNQDKVYSRENLLNIVWGYEYPLSLIHIFGKRAKAVSTQVQHLSQNQKNEGLRRVAEELENQKSYLTAENEKDIEKAEKDGMKASLIDRLRLTEERIAGMAEGLRQIADLEDPIGATLWEKVRPNGLRIGKRVVPLGVVGIIYESRPNVTADAFGLCFKTGNVVILRGGSDAIHSNLAVTKVIRKGLKKCNLPEDAILLVENTARAVVNQMMKLNKYCLLYTSTRTIRH